MPKFTYRQAVAIRELQKELEKELPEIIREESKTRTITAIAADLKYNRGHIYNILNRGK